MKIILSFLLMFALCLVAVPVYASFGVNPAIVNCQVDRGNLKSIDFIIIGYSGVVDISTIDMPATVTQSSVTVSADKPITITLKCDDSANPGIYDGRIKFLAKSGSSVLMGINVICKLSVNNGVAVAHIGGQSAVSPVISPSITTQQNILPESTVSLHNTNVQNNTANAVMNTQGVNGVVPATSVATIKIAEATEKDNSSASRNLFIIIACVLAAGLLGLIAIIISRMMKERY